MMALTTEQLKQKACDTIDAAKDELNTISQEIWTHPEENYQEHHAHKILTEYLEGKSFPVEREYLTPTGFRSVYGENSGPNISVICEYDCLPEIRHACGHNLIAEAGVAASLGIKTALDAAQKAGQHLGKLTVLGTPAEEGGGGKVDFVRTGVFDNIDAAMMVHPAPRNSAIFPATAVDMINIYYHGRASHAAGFPWQGINALDAAVMAYNGISVMRQQMKTNWRIHGVIHNGGAKPNIIPELTHMEFYARAPTTKQLQVLKQKAEACFQAAADATGCTVEMSWNPKAYDSVISNPTLAGLFAVNAQSLGVDFASEDEVNKIAGGSTDMGNVCHVVPGIHPIYYIGSDALNHTRPFNDAAGAPVAQDYTLTQAKVMAMTAIDVYCNPHLLNNMKTELKEALKKEEEEV